MEDHYFYISLALRSWHFSITLVICGAEKWISDFIFLGAHKTDASIILGETLRKIGKILIIHILTVSLDTSVATNQF